MDKGKIRQAIADGKTALGIELGSTRIKAVLLDENHMPIASGGFTWENKLRNGLWTYDLKDAWVGLASCYEAMAKDVYEKYDIEIENIGAIGISGMMHGYLPFDKAGNQISQFLTWRNTNTTAAAEKLTDLFKFNIPLRWSIAQLYQAVLNNEEHVENIDYICTLGSYIHWKLTGQKVIGIGEASGMFPIDSTINDYDQAMLDKFRKQIDEYNFSWDIGNILPKVMVAGENAGRLTEEGAKLLDPSGKLKSGIPMVPPEGDAGTGMVATNSVAERTGNVSAGTSIFAMVVLEKQLSKVYPEIDMVTTPNGKPVAMVHCNNGTSDFDAWTGIFSEVLELMGANVDKGELFTKLYKKSLEGSPDCGGVMVYNYLSGEPITGLTEGRPIVMRKPDADFNLSNFLRAQIYSILTSLRIGMEILVEEKVKIERLMGHGGLFKTAGVAQRYLAAATGAEVSVMETAGEGGSYGIAVLAAYMLQKKAGETLEDYLNRKVFAENIGSAMKPQEDDEKGFKNFLQSYEKALSAAKEAVSAF